MAAPSGLIVGWPSTVASIPAGWTRFTALDARIPKAVSSSPGSSVSGAHTHAGSTHTHTISHDHGPGVNFSGGASSTFSGDSGTAAVSVPTSHQHTSSALSTGETSASATGSYDAATGIPIHFTVIWIKSDGTTDIPTNALAWWGGAVVPSGWSAHVNSQDRFLRGAAAAADGGSQVAATSHSHAHSGGHTHGAPTGTHTHTPSASPASNSFVQTGANLVAGTSHTHAVGTGATGTGTTTSTLGVSTTATNTDSGEPPWYKLTHIQASSAAAAPAGVIALLDPAIGSVPSGWALCDGTNGTPNLVTNGFVKGTTSTAQNGTTNSSTTHSHAAPHFHSATTADTHTHTVTGNLGAPTTTTTVGAAGTPAAIGDSTHTHTTYGSPTGAFSSRSGSLDDFGTDTKTNSVDHYTIFFIQSTGPAGGALLLPYRIPNRFVGPRALRRNFHQPYLPDIPLAPLTDTNFGPIRGRLPAPGKGPPALRARFREPYFPDKRTAFPSLQVAFDAALALRTELAATFDAALATGGTKTVTFDVAPQVRTTITMTYDAVLSAVTVKTVTFDTVLSTQSVVSVTFDAALVGTQFATITFDALLGVVLGPEAGSASMADRLPPGAAEVADWIRPGAAYYSQLAAGAGEQGAGPQAGSAGYDGPRSGSADLPRQ